ncbi:hypothetical protein [Streptomyces sp. SID8014]|uniref:hypothetical protein n=1 Tax=Streptomyces sp. SID8014 TaxID=2706097 RepID=UPI001EF37AE5|nr:hypothetical protein [Streptomyces sp. SID8014]
MTTTPHGDGPVPDETRGQRALDPLDTAIARQTPPVRKNIARARRRNPDANPAEVIRGLERTYVGSLTGTGTGAAVRGTAAAPGVGTGAALALSTGEALSSLELSAVFALSPAEVHGVPVDETERRRTLVRGLVLGGSGSATVAKVAERAGRHWGRQVIAKVPVETLRQINKVLGGTSSRSAGPSRAFVVLGRVAPFGIGAVIAVAPTPPSPHRRCARAAEPSAPLPRPRGRRPWGTSPADHRSRPAEARGAAGRCAGGAAGREAGPRRPAER